MSINVPNKLNTAVTCIRLGFISQMKNIYVGRRFSYSNILLVIIKANELSVLVLNRNMFFINWIYSCKVNTAILKEHSRRINENCLATHFKQPRCFPYPNEYYEILNKFTVRYPDRRVAIRTKDLIRF